RREDGGPRVARLRDAAARDVPEAGAALRLDPGEIRRNARVEGEVPSEAVLVAPARRDARHHGPEAGVDEQRATGIAVARVRTGAGEVPADRRAVRDAVRAGRGRDHPGALEADIGRAAAAPAEADDRAGHAGRRRRERERRGRDAGDRCGELDDGEVGSRELIVGVHADAGGPEEARVLQVDEAAERARRARALT